MEASDWEIREVAGGAPESYRAADGATDAAGKVIEALSVPPYWPARLDSIRRGHKFVKQLREQRVSRWLTSSKRQERRHSFLILRYPLLVSPIEPTGPDDTDRIYSSAASGIHFFACPGTLSGT